MDNIVGSSGEATLRETLGILRRQWWVLAVAALIGIAVGVTMTFLIEPTFQSRTQMVVEGRAQPSYQSNNGYDPLRQVTMTVQDDIPTQIEIIQGSTVLQSALQSVLAINPRLRPRAMDDVDVKARQLGLTNAIEVVVTAPSAELAERLARAIPESYRDLLTRRNSSQLDGAIASLASKLDDARRNLRDADAAMARFNARHGIAPGNYAGSDRVQQSQRAELDFVQAQSEYMAATEALASLRASRAALPETVPAEATEKNITQVEAAKQRLSELQSERRRLLESFQPTAREVKEVDAQIAQQQSYIATIPKTLNNQRSIRNPDLAIYDQKIADARARMGAAKAMLEGRASFRAHASANVVEFNSLQEESARLQRNVTLRQQSVVRLDQQLSELQVFQNAVRDLVQVTFPASAPNKNRPNPPLYVALSLFVALVLATGISVIKDRLEDRVTTLDQAYRIANAPTLGYVPPQALGKAAQKSNLLPSRVTENYRIVRSNVLFSNREAPFKSMMITSTGPGEGKSEVAANLAIAMASGGKRVLLVDANFHRPSVHERFGKERDPGLGDVLVGAHTLSEAAAPTTIENLFVLTAGGGISSLADGLASDAMTALYRQMSDEYDLLIFDTPAMLPRSDALALSATVETVVYVVKPGATTKSLMRYCIELLRHARARLLGVVFTNTDFYEEATM